MDDLTGLDEKILRRTFHLAKLAKNRGNGAFGAILAEGKNVLFEAENTVTEGAGDPTCHAEMNLLREANLHYQAGDFARFTLYSSTEPCPMCAAAAFFCGVGRIVYGCPQSEYLRIRGKGLALPCRELLGHSLGFQPTVNGPMLIEESLKVHQ